MAKSALSVPSEQFVENMQFLSGPYPDLARLINDLDNTILIKPLDGEQAYFNITNELVPLTASVDGRTVVYNWKEEVSAIKTNLRSKSTTIRYQRPIAEKLDAKITANDLLFDIIGSEYPESLDHLASLRSPLHEATKAQQCRDCIVLGSLNLVPLVLAVLEESVNPISITLCETSLVDLKILLHLFSIPGMVSDLKKHGIGFSLLFNVDPQRLKYELLAFMSQSQTPSLNGLFTIESALSCPELLDLCAWFKDSDGYQSFVSGFMGNDTDEINQLAHSIWNSNSTHLQFMLSELDDIQAAAVICASGPSLDQSVSWLKENQDKVVIFASGSSLGSLLVNHIRPRFAVILEMSHIIYDDLLKFVDSGYSLEGITLIAPPTIDPRIMPMFEKTCIFHRPLSSTMAFFSSEINSALIQSGPQAANAALESALKLGFKKCILLGCDFSGPSPLEQRASLAIGESERSLDIPAKGRKGSTVFTSADLSVTAQMFQAALDYYTPDCYSTSQGIHLDGLTLLSSLTELDSLSFVNSELVSSFNHIYDQKIRSRASWNVSQILDSLPNSLHDYKDGLVELIMKQNNWSCEFSRQMSFYLNGGLSEEDSIHVLIKRLSRFPLFFIVQSLHDCIDPCIWEDVKSIVVSDIEFYFDFLESYFAKLSLLITSGVAWDHEIFNSQSVSLEELS